MRAMDDVRFSARILARNPGFSVLAVLTLALGIAAATAIFSFTNTLLWKPLPIPEDDRLIFLNEGHPGSGLKQVGVSYLNFSDWAESATSFESMAAYETTSFLMQAGFGSSSLVSGVAVSAGFFELLAVPPRMGSWLTSSPGADADTVVLGHDLWLSHLGGDPEIVGKSIVLDGISRKVVGVMPSTFRFPERHDLWVPLPRLASWDNRRARFLDVIAKLAPEVPLGRARQEMLTLTQQLREVYPESNQEFSLTMLPFREENVGEDDQLLVSVLLGTTLFVLLIACANVAHISLARASIRAREMMIRTALGASRPRIVRLLLTESWLLALLAGVLGLAAGKWAKDLLVYSMPDQFPYWMDFSMDWRVYLFVAAVIAGSGLLFGLGPALKAAPPSGERILQASGNRAGAPGGGRLRKALIIGEVTMAMTLVTGAGLMMQTWLNSQRLDLGYDPSGVLTFHTFLENDRYPEAEQRAQFYDQFQSEIGSLPGVESVTTAEWIPLQDFTGVYLYIQDQPPADENERAPIAGYMQVGRSYFATARTPLLAGRSFQPEDRNDDVPVAIVNQRLVDTFWPGQSPLGKRISFSYPSPETRWRTIVGVVPNAHISDRNEERMMAVYVPHSSNSGRSMGFLVRSEGVAPESLLPAIRERLKNLDQGAAVSGATPWEEIVAAWNWEETFFGWLFTLFSAMALLLAAIGLHGVVVYMVSQRRHEIGIRMAVGASRRDILVLTFSTSLKLAAAGILLGAVGAVVTTQFLESLLVGVSPGDPATLLLTALILIAATILATWFPARRAARVDPARCIRV